MLNNMEVVLVNIFGGFQSFENFETLIISALMFFNSKEYYHILFNNLLIHKSTFSTDKSES